jgi:hypothetical protein
MRIYSLEVPLEFLTFLHEINPLIDAEGYSVIAARAIICHGSDLTSGTEVEIFAVETFVTNVI